MVQMYAVPASAEMVKRSDRFRMSYLTNTEVDSSGSVREIHSHAEIVEIALVYYGRGVHNIGHRKYYSEPGDLLIYNAGVIHQDLASAGGVTRHYLCGLSGVQMEGLLPGVVVSDADCFLLKSGTYFDYLLQSFQLLERCLQKHSGSIVPMSQGVLQTLLAIIHELSEPVSQAVAAPSQKELPLEEKIRRYIDTNFARDFSLKELAEELHVSHYYAAHVFSKAFGTSPIRYRTLRRIGEAQSLLTSTDESVTRIASAVGYDDPNQFSQAFTKVVGMPPSKYRDLSVWPRCIRK